MSYIMYTYKRVDHFKTWLSLIQGHIAPIRSIPLHEIVSKLNPTTFSRINEHQVRRILKDLHMPWYYEYTPYITSIINGAPTVYFPPDLLETLCTMYNQMHGPFQKYCDKQGKKCSFLGNAYVLQKLLQILQQDQHYNTLLRYPQSREKLQQQDEVFDYICRELDWPIIKPVTTKK